MDLTGLKPAHCLLFQGAGQPGIARSLGLHLLPGPSKVILSLVQDPRNQDNTKKELHSEFNVGRDVELACQ